jgi:hypothetical protein
VDDAGRKWVLSFVSPSTSFSARLTPRTGIQARLDAYNKDTTIFNSASMPSKDKNFSHFAVLVMADYQHAGIWRDKISQMDKVTHQLTAVNRDVGKNSEVNNGTRCNRRPFEDCPVGLTKQLPSTEMGKEVKEQSFGCGIGAPHGWVGGTECRDWA